MVICKFVYTSSQTGPNNFWNYMLLKQNIIAKDPFLQMKIKEAKIHDKLKVFFSGFWMHVHFFGWVLNITSRNLQRWYTPPAFVICKGDRITIQTIQLLFQDVLRFNLARILALRIAGEEFVHSEVGNGWIMVNTNPGGGFMHMFYALYNYCKRRKEPKNHPIEKGNDFIIISIQLQFWVPAVFQGDSIKKRVFPRIGVPPNHPF